MEYLIIGGAGFLGQSLTKEILKGRRNKVGILDNFSSSPRPENIIKNPRVSTIYGDIGSQASTQSAINALKFEVVIFTAAFHAFNPGSDPRLETARLTNSLLHTIPFVARKRPKLFVYVSADYVYKSSDKDILTEKSPIVFGTPDSHAMQKIIGEWYVRANCTRYRLPWLIVRPSYLVGARSVVNPFVDPVSFLCDIMLHDRPFILTNQKQKRDYIDVQDAVTMILDLIKAEKSHDVYNISSGVGVTNMEIFNTLKEKIDPKGELKQVETHELSRVLDPTKVMKETSLKKLTPLEDLFDLIIKNRSQYVV